MPYVPVPKDLTTVKTKVAFNLTKRQLICFGLAAAVAVPTYFLTRGALGTSGAVMTLVIAALPFFFLAMYEKDGQPAEKILKNRLRYKLWPKNRPYRTDNLYKSMSKKEVTKIAKKQAAGSSGKASAKKISGRPKRPDPMQSRAKLSLPVPKPSKKKAAFLPG